MRTARRLFVVHVLPCFLALALSMAPAVAQGELQFWQRGDAPMHPILGGITDDPGPFNRIRWTNLEDQFENMTYIPQEESAATRIADPPMVQFNSVSGYPIAAWTTGESDDRNARGQEILFSHFSVGGWAAPQRLAVGAADPSMLIDPASGDVHMIYWMPNDGGGVWHRQAPADLRAWTDPVRVSDAGEAAAYPMAQLHAGTLSIAYESHLLGLRSTPRDIVLAQRALSGDRYFTRTVLARTDFAGRNWVRLDSEDGVGNSDGPKRLLVRWINAENEAGWILQDGRGGWGPTGLMPLLSSDPGASPATRKTESKPGRRDNDRVGPGR